jgi:hypothetical protein
VSVLLKNFYYDHLPLCFDKLKGAFEFYYNDGSLYVSTAASIGLSQVDGRVFHNVWREQTP